MEDQNQNKKVDERISEEMRFKYIGFDVYPNKAKEFWRSKEEKRKYLEEAKQKSSESAVAERDHSLVRAVVFSKVDRMVLTITSFLLTVSLFVPWFSIRGEAFHSQVIGLGFFLKLGALFGYAPLSGPLFSVFVVLVSLTILFSFVAGLMSLLAIYKKHSDVESYLTNLKKKLQLNWIPLVLWVAVIIISTIGMPTPFADALNVGGFGDSFNVANFFALASFGVWLSLPCVIINCVKISDL
ncbi:MAG: hypothetical protein AMJ91_01705 [candidate division Zixibacteria bacterium SM23_73_3]|nr:MAG: hypothetical protein AMJ91_01705 [candidate division Zixibacteria bacterium SM23_73_3]